MNDYTNRLDDQPAVDQTEEHIVEEIEETRAGLSGTIDEIGHRLNPQNIANQAREQVREATVGRVERFVDDAGQTAQQTSSSIIETIRQNPVPAALAALGIGWLVMKGRDSGGNGGSRRSYAYSGGYDRYGGYGYGTNGQQSLGSKTRDVAGNLAGTVSGAGEQLRQRTDEIGMQAQMAASDVAERSQQAIADAQWQLERAGSQAQRQLDRTLQENPLAVAALAIGVGAAVGLALPETRREQELLGEQRDRLVGQVEQVATRALTEAENTARQTGEQMREQVTEA
jgi:ElaB/YqjD/DUF883 family membrane-anchored ribosome-binding protein